MKNSKAEEVVFGACASCTLVTVGVAFVTLLYELVTAAVPLVASMMSQRFMATGF